jgi:hypothetical protein
MAYVVARAGGRFELRETSLTRRGPRGRTLATFRVLSPEVMDHAEQRAGRRLDWDAVRRRARRAGAPVASPPADERAGEMLGLLAHGESITPVRAHLVAHALAPEAVAAPDHHLRAAGEWAGTDAAARGAALRDVLTLVDAIPAKPRTRPLRFPRLSSDAS